MGTTSSAASQAASISTPIYFTGLSSFSNDFQSIIQRAVQIANIPVANLQNQQATITSQEQALAALEPTVSALGADVANLGMLASTQGLSASSSDSTTVSVLNTGAAAPASYKISNITSLASRASEASLQGYAATDAVSSTGFVNLVIGSHTYQLNLTGAGQNNVNGLAQAINNAGAGVSATVLTSGSTSYLSVTANQTGATTLQLNNVTPADIVNSGLSTETSLLTYADTTTVPVSATGQLQLIVGGKTYSLDISASNNLNGLAQAINASGSGVIATITGGTGPYSLSLTPFGSTPVQLNDLGTPTNLLSSTNQGSNATFSLSGIPAPITESSNTITDVIPGVSFTLQKTTAGSVNLSLTTDPTQLSSALQSFVTDYNALVTAVSAQHGQNAGPLQGNLIVNEISADMQSLVTYWNPTSNSTIHSLSDLGVTFNNSGQMSFDSNTFNALSDTQISDAFKFLGSANSGFAALAGNFTQLSDPISGLIQTQIDGYQSEITDLGNHVATAQARAAAIATSATNQAKAADALVAQLQQQQNTLDSSVQSLDYVLYGRHTGANGI